METENKTAEQNPTAEQQAEAQAQQTEKQSEELGDEELSAVAGGRHAAPPGYLWDEEAGGLIPI